MLREISCSKFIDEGIERPPLKFEEGLNAVLGSSTGSNSIGKSTLLLIIDFAFGGDTYSKQKDVLKNVGPHDIEFCFCFDGANHRFSRSPMNPSTVWKCDKEYSKIESLKSDEFKQWLARQYGLDGLGDTFRGLCSTFFRVHGKDNHDPSRPLAASTMETKKVGVTRLLKLLGKYAAVSEAQKIPRRSHQGEEGIQRLPESRFYSLRQNEGRSQSERNEYCGSSLPNRRA